MTELEQNYVMIGNAELFEAKRMKDELTLHSIDSRIQTEAPQSAGGGQKISAEIWVNKNDIPKLQAYMQKKAEKTFAGLTVNFETINSVYDPSKAESVCPACSTKFSTASKCPECGLVFFEDPNADQKTASAKTQAQAEDDEDEEEEDPIVKEDAPDDGAINKAKIQSDKGFFDKLISAIFKK